MYVVKIINGCVTDIIPAGTVTVAIAMGTLPAPTAL